MDQKPKAIQEDLSYLDDSEFVQSYATHESREMLFYLEGVHCAACVWLTEKLPDFCPGVEFLQLNLASGVARVRLYESGSFAQAAREIARLGYRPFPVKQGQSDELRKKEDRKLLIQLGVAGMLSGNIMLLAVALYAGASGALAELFKWSSFILFLPVLFYSAVPFFKSAWASLRVKQVSIDVPIVFGLAVGTAVSIVNLFMGSDQIYFDSLSTLVFLLLSTRYLLKKVNQHALNSSEWAHFLAPAKAKRFIGHSSKTETVSVNLLRPNDLIQVLPGECFPVDGVVVQGEGAVNCSLLTGESALVAASPGTAVNAGTWNQHSPLIVRVVASGPKTRLNRILASVESSLRSRAPIVAYVDRVGQAFVVAVLALAVLGFFIGLFVSGVQEGFQRALAIAIVVCPCTFALATPLAISLSIGRAAKAGILVKGADVLERLSQVRTVFFDKTGTLTVGELRVSHWDQFSDGAAEALMALEIRSAHPIARAVQRYFQGRFEWLPEVEDFREQPGKGVSGTIRGDRFEVRSHPSLDQTVSTRVGLFKNGVIVGAMTFSDVLREDSKSSVDQLKAMGLHVGILSGDAGGPVQDVSGQLGIQPGNSFSALSPEQKAEVVKGSPFTLMVGDGANDAVALAQAHASVAVQGGMEMSLRVASVYSSQSGVRSIPALLVLAQETLRVIRRNLVFAVVYNLVGIAVALSGRLDPLFAAVLMPLSALTVFLSTMAGTGKLRRAFR
ncbi:MAG: cadmium-translocating P-type ATPase [Bdellovibrionales bacterium]|nr:cadmium-translocating P-type ATPase [Bdellovibrionales bacterium]